MKKKKEHKIREDKITAPTSDSVPVRVFDLTDVDVLNIEKQMELIRQQNRDIVDEIYAKIEEIQNTFKGFFNEEDT